MWSKPVTGNLGINNYVKQNGVFRFTNEFGNFVGRNNFHKCGPTLSVSFVLFSFV